MIKTFLDPRLKEYQETTFNEIKLKKKKTECKDLLKEKALFWLKNSFK